MGCDITLGYIEKIYSKKPKHQGAIFLATRKPNGALLFIGKVYGHEGQDAEAIANRIISSVIHCERIMNNDGEQP